jgi:hypothetical protein
MYIAEENIRNYVKGRNRRVEREEVHKLNSSITVTENRSIGMWWARQVIRMGDLRN